MKSSFQPDYDDVPYMSANSAVPQYDGYPEPPYTVPLNPVYATYWCSRPPLLLPSPPKSDRTRPKREFMYDPVYDSISSNSNPISPTPTRKRRRQNHSTYRPATPSSSSPSPRRVPRYPIEPPGKSLPDNHMLPSNGDMLKQAAAMLPLLRMSEQPIFP